MSKSRYIELTEPLIDKVEEKVIDVRIAPEWKVALSFPNRHLQAYFFSFLDIRSLANYTFIDKSTLKNVLDHANSPQVGIHKPHLMNQLRNIAYSDKDKKLIDDCSVAMKHETKETYFTKIKRHLTWSAPLLTETAFLGRSFYNLSQLNDAYIAIGNGLSSFRGGMAKTCMNFFELWVDQTHRSISYYCQPKSDVWIWCSQQKVMPDLCHKCIDDCINLSSLGNERTSIGNEAMNSKGVILGAVVVGIGTGIVVAGCWNKIKDLYNPMKKPVARLSKQTKDQIAELNLECKATDTAQTIIQKLERKKTELDKKKLPDYVRFVLFRQTLPDKTKEPKKEKAPFLKSS